MYKQLQESVQFLKSAGMEAPQIGIVLGTGLNKILDSVDVKVSVSYADIPHFPISTVEFHKGNLIYGYIDKKPVIIMQGRFHFYEGYSMQQIVFPIRVMKLLGVSALFLSNAAGGINANFKKGDFVLINDHIHLQSGNPLIGENIDELGPRFPDMSSPYSSLLGESLKQNASILNLPLKEGVYASVNGPNLETRAEYRYLKIIKADLVGMSTVPEVIAANHMQLPCAAISVVTDECDPDNLQPVNIAEIIDVATKADAVLSSLLIKTITSL